MPEAAGNAVSLQQRAPGPPPCPPLPRCTPWAKGKRYVSFMSRAVTFTALFTLPASCEYTAKCLSALETLRKALPAPAPCIPQTKRSA